MDSFLNRSIYMVVSTNVISISDILAVNLWDENC